MKNIKMLLFAAIIFVLVMPVQSISAESNIRVFIDGEQVMMNVNPIIEKGTTLVPFRPVFEKLGLTIKWDDKTKTVTGTANRIEIKLKINDSNAIVNKRNVKLTIPPKIINGNTYVPLRFIGEATGKQVDWHSASRSVYIFPKLVAEDPLTRMQWDMTKEQVKRAEWLKEVNSNNMNKPYLLYENPSVDTGELKYDLQYDFDYNLLTSISYMSDLVSFEEILPEAMRIIEYYRGVYGDDKQSIFHWKVDEITQNAYLNVYGNETADMVEMAMRSDELILYSSWFYENTLIQFSVANYGTFKNPQYGAFLVYKNSISDSIHKAAFYNDTKWLGIHLKEGANPNSLDDYNTSPLVSAILNDSIDAVKLLIANGADVNKRHENGRTPLTYATENINITKLLLDAGADPNSINDWGSSVLISASADPTMGSEGYPDVVQTLIDAGANVNFVAKDGMTALLKAAYYEQAKVVKVLLDNGADPQLSGDEETDAIKRAKNNLKNIMDKLELAA